VQLVCQGPLDLREVQEKQEKLVIPVQSELQVLQALQDPEARVPRDLQEIQALLEVPALLVHQDHQVEPVH